jgi:hypothetical protein
LPPSRPSHADLVPAWTIRSWPARTHEPRSGDGGVQRARYDVYVFDLASFATIGGPPSAPVDVVVELDSRVETTLMPVDPNLPAPQGGFTLVVRTGRVIGAAP